MIHKKINIDVMLLIHISLQIVAVVSELVTYHYWSTLYCSNNLVIIVQQFVYKTVLFSYHESSALKERVWFCVCGHIPLSGCIAVEGI